MSKIKDMLIDIQDLLEQGMEPNDIARILQVPVNWVYEAQSIMEDDCGE